MGGLSGNEALMEIYSKLLIQTLPRSFFGHAEFGSFLFFHDNLFAFKTDVSGGCFGYLRLKTLSELDPDLKGELRVPVLVTTGGQSCGKTTFIQAGRLAFHQEK